MARLLAHVLAGSHWLSGGLVPVLWELGFGLGNVGLGYEGLRVWASFRV